MALHFRHASVNTALDFDSRPQSNDGSISAGLSPRPRSPLGHLRMQSLGTTEKVGEDGRPLLFEEKHITSVPPFVQRWSPSRNNCTTLTILWMFSIFLSCLGTYIITRPASSINPYGTFESGFHTELRDARQSVRVQKHHFTGSLDFKGHHGFVPHHSPSLRYIGHSPIIDAAWEELTADRYFLLEDNEAREAYGSPPHKYWNDHHGGYVAGLDVLHTLHCLNHLRMSLYPEVYPQDPVDGPMHKAHCIDHLRQLAMCNADLTPVPTQYFDGLGRSYINSSREHTCRDFSEVRLWATERFNGSMAVKARNRDGKQRSPQREHWILTL